MQYVIPYKRNSGTDHANLFGRSEIFKAIVMQNKNEREAEFQKRYIAYCYTTVFQECCFLLKEYIVSRHLFSFEEITYNVCPLFKTYHAKKTLRGWPNFIKRYIAYFHTFVLQERGSSFSFNNNLFLFQGMLQCSLTTALLDRLETQFFLAHISGNALLVDSGVWTYI